MGENLYTIYKKTSNNAGVYKGIYQEFPEICIIFGARV